ncbi:FAD-binding oxidoreductase [Streptomyces radicis]|uniref:FAD-binding oxidoreductase n=1 Tax=Streptomyces radicis TaxID=1750517 RepID=UPI001C7D8874|nr:FAD-binding oxidoreductase [Streptomyces radicis]
MNGFSGQLYRPGDGGYDAERAGHNLAVDHRPAYVVGATGAGDVATAVGRAVAEGLGVGVLATGHGPSVAADARTVLVNTRRMNGVTVDPVARVARVEAGARWRDVLAATTPHGLAPLNGSSPAVGAVGYTLGGGAGLLGRRHGYAADHVRRFELVTATGESVSLGPAAAGDLFWALCGAGQGRFGVVTAMEIDLFPVARLYGGGLFFAADAVGDVARAYAAWTDDVPDGMASSLKLARSPDVPGVPGPLRGRFTAHVRIAWSGRADEGERLVAPLRAVAPRVLDTVGDMPYAEVGTIHAEPTEPVSAHDRGTLLGSLPPRAVETLLALAGPAAGAPFVCELRHFGGAFARPQGPRNAICHREAAFSLFTAVAPDPDPSQDALHEALRPWALGSFTNFLGAGQAATGSYDARTAGRLAALERHHDPEGVFRTRRPLT